MIDGSEISPGDMLIGLSSSGLHSNGYSLVRKIVFDYLQLHVDDWIEELGRTVGDELLEPTRIYAKTVMPLRREFRLLGIAHITGGGGRSDPAERTGGRGLPDWRDIRSKGGRGTTGVHVIR